MPAKKILYLVHRIPYPPNKGDKIRSYHILKELNKHFKVYLGSFIDDINDRQYKSILEQQCEECFFQEIDPKFAKIKSLRGLLSGEALSVPYYTSDKFQSWVDGIIQREKIDGILIFSSTMAQFVLKYSQDYRCVVDFVDIDSDKWTQYAKHQKWPFSWIYQREGKKLFLYEKQISHQVYKSLFVSEFEAKMYADKIGYHRGIDFMNNGVDSDFFSPQHQLDNPYKNDKILVFTGAMDYWANVDAVTWFAQEIFPSILQKQPKAEFYIVGARPTEAVLKLNDHAGITVTGSVEDIRPYLLYAHTSVAPLRIARGIQNKVLEAFSMGKYVIASQAAMDGINISAEIFYNVAQSAEEMIECCLKRLEQKSQYEEAAREFILQNYHWDKSLHGLQQWFEEG